MRSCDNIMFQENGGAYIAGLIQKAVESGDGTCTVSGNWEIEQAIRIPSGFTLILDGCHLRMKDGVICNMFVNEHLGCVDPLIRDYDICIEGRGKAILDGGEPNGVNERAIKADPEKFPGITTATVNSLILCTHVDGIRIHGLQLRNQRYWAMTFGYCCHGVLQNLDFRSNDIRILENGEKVHGLTVGKGGYEATYVKNSDGIDLRCGCHDFLIENITGFTQDDSVALTALFERFEKKYYVEGQSRDICNVIIRNVNTTAYMSNVRLLSGDGNKLHDILVDGVMSGVRECRFTDGAIGAQVKIGDKHNYSETLAQRGDLYNITVKNLYGTAKSKPLDVNCIVYNLQVENINCS